MAGDSLGTLFRIVNWGESHGPAIGITIEGLPPNISLAEADIQKDLDRRRPGQSHITTARNESDTVRILSGLEMGKTTGAALSLHIANTDMREKDYSSVNDVFRPSHADFSYFAKYGIRSKNGGGRSSARLTAGSVAAGAVAKKVLKQFFSDFSLLAFVRSIADIESPIESTHITAENIEGNIVRSSDSETAKIMTKRIEEAKQAGDSLGGVVECLISGLPAGLGEPLYDKLDADLAKAMLSINACKGFEIGSGFQGTRLKGSAHNDVFIQAANNKVQTLSNHSGGVQGGISNGMPIVFRAAFKPTATILKKQTTLNEKLEVKEFQAKGRHDPCVLPRAVPIVEAMAALVLADHTLRHRAQVGSFYSASSKV